MVPDGRRRSRDGLPSGAIGRRSAAVGVTGRARGPGESHVCDGVLLRFGDRDGGRTARAGRGRGVVPQGGGVEGSQGGEEVDGVGVGEPRWRFREKSGCWCWCWWWRQKTGGVCGGKA